MIPAPVAAVTSAHTRHSCFVSSPAARSPTSRARIRCRRSPATGHDPERLVGFPLPLSATTTTSTGVLFAIEAVSPTRMGLHVRHSGTGSGSERASSPSPVRPRVGEIAVRGLSTAGDTDAPSQRRSRLGALSSLDRVRQSVSLEHGHEPRRRRPESETPAAIVQELCSVARGLEQRLHPRVRCRSGRRRPRCRAARGPGRACRPGPERCRRRPGRAARWCRCCLPRRWTRRDRELRAWTARVWSRSWTTSLVGVRKALRRYQGPEQRSRRVPSLAAESNTERVLPPCRRRAYHRGTIRDRRIRAGRTARTMLVVR